MYRHVHLAVRGLMTVPLGIAAILWTVSTITLFLVMVKHSKAGVSVKPILTNSDTGSVEGHSRSDTSAANNANWQFELFLHPNCVCTRTTLQTLANILKEIQGEYQLKIYVANYESSERNWCESPNYRLASKMKNAVFQEDPNAIIARSRGATASGTLAIWNVRGELVYFGGVSDSRSGEVLGANRLAITKVISGQQFSSDEHLVYGCEL